MTELGTITSSMYTELTNFLKPSSTTQSVESNSKGLKLQNNVKTKEEEENVDELSVTNEKFRSYYDNLKSSGLLEKAGSSTTSNLTDLIATAVGQGMSVQDAHNMKNGITAYNNVAVSEQPIVSVEVDV